MNTYSLEAQILKVENNAAFWQMLNNFFKQPIL